LRRRDVIRETTYYLEFRPAEIERYVLRSRKRANSTCAG